jgi:hypothetical protein
MASRQKSKHDPDTNVHQWEAEIFHTDDVGLIHHYYQRVRQVTSQFIRSDQYERRLREYLQQRMMMNLVVNQWKLCFQVFVWTIIPQTGDAHRDMDTQAVRANRRAVCLSDTESPKVTQHGNSRQLNHRTGDMNPYTTATSKIYTTLTKSCGGTYHESHEMEEKIRRHHERGGVDDCK